MIHFKITPDSRLDNRESERLAKTLFTYKNMFQRWHGKGFSKKPFFSYEIKLQKGGTEFFLTVPDDAEMVAKKAAESVWNNSAVEKVEDPFVAAPQILNRLSLERHYMFALKVDRRRNGMLESLLETLNNMSADDMAYIQILAVPAPQDWVMGAADAYRRFKSGQMPTKIHLSKKGITNLALKTAAKTVFSIIDGMTVVSGGKPEPIDFDGAERAMLLRDGQLRRETLQKAKAEAYEVHIRTAVVCNDPVRAVALDRMINTAFRDLDGDNSLIVSPSDPKSFTDMKNRKPSLQIQKDYLSIPELARMTLLPSGALQDTYDIPHIGRLETDVPERLLKGGLLLGHHERKGRKQNVYYPCNNWDEICLPCAIVGGMGQGKTKGFGANKIVQGVKNGFGALCLDPAKGEIGKEVASQLKPHQVIRINLGEKPIAIDWRETKHAVRSRNRLANTILGFFGDDDTGGQTTRFLRASVFGMKTTNIKELLTMWEDENYLKECLKEMPDSIHKTTLTNLSQYSDARRRQVLDPLYNRMDDIMGDEYLAECFDAKEGLDMVEIMSQKKAVIIDIPQKLVGDAGVNLIGNLIITKINLAMTLREEKNQFPFFIVIDEPHQFTRSKNVWKTACVESRKWRVGYNFMFHDWVQLDRELRSIMSNAGLNYHLYPSGKKNFAALAEEIAPFTVEDALKMPSHHAINIIRSGGEQIKPFMLKMTKPPSMQGKA
ncbi:ATPase-like protein [Bacillus phage 031MP002]|nr:ATPase-like protein [Bacillus phage 031MP003]QFG05542.1 ATPase-like protein [Bacillus phage 031MP002]